jgi:hypothetical protein
MFLLNPTAAIALTWDEIVTTKFVREHPDLVSVTVTEKEEGMISFTVSMKFKHARYVITQMKVRDAKRTLSVSRTPMFTHVEKDTFHFSIPRDLIGSSTYSVSVGFALERDGREPVPLPGSTRYLFRLSDLVSPKVTENADVAREFAEAAGESLTIER